MTPRADARQVSLLPPDVAETLHLVRENLRLLAGLTPHYEVARLASGAGRLSVRRPDDIATYLGPEMADLDQEQLRVVLLDTRNAVLGIHLVFQGGLNATVIRLADCFREAVRANAAAILLVHNHPSGNPAPSPADVELTCSAAQAGELLGIELLDHVVIGRGRHASLRQLGLYTPPGRAPVPAPAEPDDEQAGAHAPRDTE